MELTNEFEVSVPAEEAWTVLTDVERIAPCLPGAQLQEVDGDDYLGTVKVKVGPITAKYEGKAHFVERDDSTHRAVLAANGRDTRGQGNASANITATLTPAGDRTHVSIVTDLNVTGKVAQFGRGVLADVSAKLMDEFVTNLEDEVLGAPDDPRAAADADTAGSTGSVAASAAAGRGATEPGVHAEPASDVEAVDLLGTAGAPVAKRLVPVVGAVVAVVAFGYLLRRRRR